MKYLYKVYGVILSSELELPELVPVDHCEPDVIISYGKVPEHLPEVRGSGVLFEAAPNDFLFKFKGIGRFRVQNGQQITIHPENQAQPDEIRLFLLGSNIGALLHQRGMLAIHGSAVTDGVHTTILSGKSGSGKSSLAAGLMELGYSVIADDISVINWNEHRGFFVENGIPHLKLWKDVLEHFRQSDDLERIRPQLEKYRKPIPTPNAKTSTLKDVLILTSFNATGFSHTEILGHNKFFTLQNTTYRLQYIDKLKQTAHHFQNLSNLINSIKIFRTYRPHEPIQVREFAAYVSENILLG